MEFNLICLDCKHYNIKENNCAAFSEIPDEIYINGNPHTDVLPNQISNVVFEPKT